MFEILRKAIKGEPITKREFGRATAEGVVVAGTAVASAALSGCAPAEGGQPSSAAVAAEIGSPMEIQEGILPKFRPLTDDQRDQLEQLCIGFGEYRDLEINNKGNKPGIQMVNPRREEKLGDKNFSLFSGPNLDQEVADLPNEITPFFEAPVASIKTRDIQLLRDRNFRGDFQLYRLSTATQAVKDALSNSRKIRLGDEEFIMVCSHNSDNYGVPNFVDIDEEGMKELIKLFQQEKEKVEQKQEPKQTTTPEPEKKTLTPEQAEYVDALLEDLSDLRIEGLDSYAPYTLSFLDENEVKKEYKAKMTVKGQEGGNFIRSLPHALSNKEGSYGSGDPIPAKFGFELVTSYADGRKLKERWICDEDFSGDDNRRFVRINSQEIDSDGTERLVIWDVEPPTN